MSLNDSIGVLGGLYMQAMAIGFDNDSSITTNSISVAQYSILDGIVVETATRMPPPRDGLSSL